MPRVAPYTVSTRRREASGSSSYREQRAGWVPNLSDVACDIQLARGEVEPTPHGQEAGASHNGWFDSGLDLLPGDGVEVEAGPGMVGQRFVVETAHDWGAPGDLEVELTQTQEVFE